MTKKGKEAKTAVKPIPNSPPVEAKPDLSLAKTSAQLKALQVAAWARSLTPIPIDRRPSFNIKTKEDVLNYQVCIAELNMDRLLSGHDMVAQNQAVRNMISIICPPQQNLTVIQSQISPVNIEDLPLEVQEAYYEYLKKQRLQNINEDKMRSFMPGRSSRPTQQLASSINNGQTSTQ